MKCHILMAYALTSKNYFGNLFQWRNALRNNKFKKYLRNFPHWAQCTRKVLD
jgi:hypothetical protein